VCTISGAAIKASKVDRALRGCRKCIRIVAVFIASVAEQHRAVVQHWTRYCSTAPSAPRSLMAVYQGLQAQQQKTGTMKSFSAGFAASMRTK
jgi:hypothetical protein